MSQLRKALEKVCGEDLALAGRVDPWPGTHACPSEKKKKKIIKKQEGAGEGGKGRELCCSSHVLCLSTKRPPCPWVGVWAQDFTLARDGKG